MRSGQHAIHLWIISGLERVAFFTAAWWNNQLHPPFRRLGEDAPQCLRSRFVSAEAEHTVIETEEVPLSRLQPWPAAIYGPRETCVWIVVLRAFPNWLASRVEFERKRPLNGNKTANPLDEWVAYAEHAIETTERNDVVTILYDLWVISQQYRDIIAKKLGLDPAKLSVDYVPHNGGGSSFIGIAQEEDASRYVTRYTTLDSTADLALCLEPRCRALTEKLFGAELCDPMYAHLEQLYAYSNST